MVTFVGWMRMLMMFASGIILDMGGKTIFEKQWNSVGWDMKRNVSGDRVTKT